MKDVHLFLSEALENQPWDQDNLVQPGGSFPDNEGSILRAQ